MQRVKYCLGKLKTAVKLVIYKDMVGISSTLSVSCGSSVSGTDSMMGKTGADKCPRLLMPLKQYLNQEKSYCSYSNKDFLLVVQQVLKACQQKKFPPLEGCLVTIWNFNDNAEVQIILATLTVPCYQVSWAAHWERHCADSC